jgi:hypothetical protein
MSFASVLAVGDVQTRAVLGSDVTYTSGTGASVVVRGIFDACYVRVDVGEVGVASVGPAVWLALADLPSSPLADSGARVTADGVTYASHEAEPDGMGGVLVLLHRVS